MTAHLHRRHWLAGLALGAAGTTSRGQPPMTRTAQGSFTVTMTPQGEPVVADGVSTARLLLAKQFDGDLVATGRGEMLTALTPVPGSAGYVAIERVTGTLHGRAGSFVFQHSGSLHQGSQQLSIGVVPGSGTGALVGLAGQFTLRIEQGRHLYTFDYSLPDQRAEG